MDLNYIAILVSTIIFFGIGAAWYGLLSKQWLNAIEKTQKDLQNMKNMPTNWFPYVMSFIMIGLLNVTLAYFIAALDYTSALDGALLGATLWGGFTATSLLTHGGYEDKKFSAFFINGGYFLIGSILSGIILALWR
jgi:hypothetical protein